MKVYYWNGRKNFGDLLTPLLIKRFSKLNSEWVEPKKADLIMVGSILEHMPLNWCGIIAGAGKLHEGSKLKFTNARVLGVRGELTARDLGLRGNYVLGDPGLLADELVPLEDKKYHLGIVPHWTDTTLEKDPRFTKYNPIIIRPENDPLKVISQIGRCRKIVSSSLHGIVTADAFGIPRRIEIAPKMLSHKNIEGGLYKWMDYSSSLGMKLEIGVTQDINRNKVTEIQHELFDVFQEIKKVFSPDVL